MARPGARGRACRAVPLLLPLLLAGLFGQSAGRVYDTDPETALDAVMRQLGQNPAPLSLLRGAGEGDVGDVGEGTQDVICSGCMSTLRAIKTLIMLGVKWKDTRNDVVSLCKNVINANNWKGDVICPGVMDNFGPLIYDAIKESRKSAKNICIHMNWCDPYELSPDTSSSNTSATAGYTRHFRRLLGGGNHGNGLANAANTPDRNSPNRSEEVQSARRLNKVGQGQGHREDHVKVRTPVVAVPHSPAGLRVDDLPVVSQLLADLDLGGNDLGQLFSRFVHALSSPESWRERGPVKKLIAQCRVLSGKLREAVANIKVKDSIDPNARRMAEVVGAALTRTSKRLRRHLVGNTGNLLKVAQLSDIHVEQEYVTGTATDCGLPVCCRPESAGTGTSGVWGDWACNVPPSTVRKLMRSAAAHNPDLVIYTGDNPPHTVWLETLEKLLNASRWVARELASHFPNTTVYPNIGNHENFPLNIYYVPRPETQALNREWAEMFKSVAGFGPEQMATINKAGYYSMLIKPGLRLIAYNTNYGGVGNFMNVLNYARPEFLEMLAWLETALAHARSHSERVFLTSHHEAGMQENVVSFDETLTPLFVEYSDVIVWHPCGHTHREEFRLTLDPATGDPVGVTFIAQSMNTYPDVNPGYRIYYFDPDTFEALDYEQYHIDVQKANENPGGSDVVTLYYRASELYGLVDLTPPSMMALYNRLMADDALLQRYWEVQRGGTGAEGTCHALCRQSQLCHLISPTFDVYRACMRHLPDVAPQTDVAPPGDMAPPRDVAPPDNVAPPGDVASPSDVAPPGGGFAAGVYSDHSGACVAGSARWVALTVTGIVALVTSRGLV